mmetsp:Transcript_20795/g.39521  ORF Transcript_20795/g.39521 Transcript_20795/m.39521 type:complete len:268 (-) Transcript_20795:969-1772(-)
MDLPQHRGRGGRGHRPAVAVPAHVFLRALHHHGDRQHPQPAARRRGHVLHLLGHDGGGFLLGLRHRNHDRPHRGHQQGKQRVRPQAGSAARMDGVQGAALEPEVAHREALPVPVEAHPLHRRGGCDAVFVPSHAASAPQAPLQAHRRVYAHVQGHALHLCGRDCESAEGKVCHFGGSDLPPGRGWQRDVPDCKGEGGGSAHGRVRDGGGGEVCVAGRRGAGARAGVRRGAGGGLLLRGDCHGLQAAAHLHLPRHDPVRLVLAQARRL